MSQSSEVRAAGGAVPLVTAPASNRQSQVRGRVAAVATALVFTIGFGGSLFLGPPGGGTTSETAVTDYYRSTGNLVTGAIFGLITVAGCLLMMWFFTELSSRLADTMLTRVGHTIAIVGSALIIVGTEILLAPTGVRLFTGASFGGGTFVGVSSAITAGQAGIGVMLFGGVYSLATAIFLLSLAARRQRTALPGWLAVAGMVIGVLLVASVIGTPALLLVVWLLLVAATGFRSGMATRSR